VSEPRKVYEWRPAGTPTLTRDLIFVGLFAVILLWEVAADGTINPFLLAMAIGTVLRVVLQAAHAAFAWRMRGWALPVFIFLCLALPFEHRLWMFPLLLFLIVMFGAMAFLPSGKVILTEEGLKLRTFGLIRCIRYTEIESLLPAGQDEKIRALTLVLRNAPTKALGLFRRSREVPILIAREQTHSFIKEVEQRMDAVSR
jgi:hypothetical protein